MREYYGNLMADSFNHETNILALIEHFNLFLDQQPIKMVRCFTSQSEEVDHFLVLHMIITGNYYVQFVLSDTDTIAQTYSDT